MEEQDLERFRTPDVLITDRRLADFAARLRTGRVAGIALVDDRVCGYGWLSQQTEVDTTCGIEIAPGKDEGYIYDGFIFSSYRGRRMYGPLLSWRLNWLRKQGCQKAYSIVFSDNAAALTAHRRVGFNTCAQIRFVKFLGFRFRRKYVTYGDSRGSHYVWDRWVG
jgi:RimJ/RimL family protein N-acetyltransferase